MRLVPLLISSSSFFGLFVLRGSFCGLFWFSSLRRYPAMSNAGYEKLCWTAYKAWSMGTPAEGS